MNGHEEILAHIGRLAMLGSLPSQPEAVLQILIAAGFDAADAVAALQSAGITVLSPVSPRREQRSRKGRTVPVHFLGDDESNFLAGLRDLGYLTEDMEEHALDLLLEEAPDGTTIGMDALRRAVASVLFERQSELDGETLKFLDEEWRLAFH